MKILKVDANGMGSILDVSNAQAKKESSRFSRLAEIELGFGVEIPLVLTDIMSEREFVLYYTCDSNAGERNRPVMNILPEDSEAMYGSALFTKLIKDDTGYTLSGLSDYEINALQEEMGLRIPR